MRRTQLNLDEKTYYHLAGYARREKTSISFAARKLISKQLEQEKIDDPQNHPLLGLVELGKKLNIKLPKDASVNHDYYLYGEGNPKFRTKKTVRKVNRTN